MASLNLGFLIHIIIEVPAFINFFFAPSRQLGTLTPHAHPVIRQYAVLLLSTVLVAISFVRHPQDDMSSKVAAAFAIYHIAPAVRSWVRLVKQARSGEPVLLTEAFLYLVVHVICCAALLHHASNAIYT
jgi:hypothetical protein